MRSKSFEDKLGTKIHVWKRRLPKNEYFGARKIVKLPTKKILFKKVTHIQGLRKPILSFRTSNLPTESFLQKRFHSLKNSGQKRKGPRMKFLEEKKKKNRKKGWGMNDCTKTMKRKSFLLATLRVIKLEFFIRPSITDWKPASPIKLSCEC